MSAISRAGTAAFRARAEQTSDHVVKMQALGPMIREALERPGGRNEPNCQTMLTIYRRAGVEAERGFEAIDAVLERYKHGRAELDLTDDELNKLDNLEDRYNAEIDQMHEVLPEIGVELQSARLKAQAKNKKACYVATAVYGSYDTPEVWVLRRLRDQFLARAVLGRAFIAAYYWISPRLLRRDGRLLVRLAAGPIAALVAYLRRHGVPDTPYED